MFTLKNVKDGIKTIIPDSLMVHRLPRQAQNCIALTFDDGPNEKITPLVLELLEEHRARAIFFVVGRFAINSPLLVKMIREKGHIIGNHTYTHTFDKMPSFLSYRKDIIRCQATIKRITGVEPTLYRSPRGIISPKTLISAKSLNLRTVLWSNEGGEWGNSKSEDYSSIATRLRNTLIPRDILLLHDNNPKVPKILDIILPALNARKIDLYGGVEYLL